MKKFVSCFECGFDYIRVEEESCRKCGEERIFIAKIHDLNFDIMKDPFELFKARMIGVTVIVAILLIVLIVTK